MILTQANHYFFSLKGALICTNVALQTLISFTKYYDAWQNKFLWLSLSLEPCLYIDKENSAISIEQC